MFLVTATYPWGLFGDAAPAPAAGTGWLGGDQPWRLVLSSGAKGLVGMFLAIGVLVAAGYGALIGVAASSSSNNTVSTADAAQAVNSAYIPLRSTTRSYQPDLAACGNEGCVNGVNARMSQAYSKFSADLRGIPMPTAATSAAAAVTADANQLASDFQRLTTASSASQYHQIETSTGLNSLLLRFAAQLGGLERMLGVA